MCLTRSACNRLSKDYENVVSEFVKFAVAHAKDPSRMTCPCLYCCYGNRVDAVQLASHLIRCGIDRSYTCWNMHGEKSNRNVEWGVRGPMLQTTIAQIH